MHMDDAQGWVLIIVAVGTAVTSIIAAFKTIQVGRITNGIAAATNAISTKTDEVHTLVNATATEQRAEIAMLRNLLTAKQMEASIAESARVALATAASTALGGTATNAEQSPLIKP